MSLCRLSDVMAVLSTATDLSMGQPINHALTTCVVAMRLGDALGFDDTQLHDVYYESLLRYIGCNAETTWLASLVGDEIALRTASLRLTAPMVPRSWGPWSGSFTSRTRAPERIPSRAPWHV